MGKLLNPKVVSRVYEYLTYVEYQKLLKSIKMKKFGFKDVALETEEVTVKVPEKVIMKTVIGNRQNSKVDVRQPGTYYHVRLEYIV